MSCQWADDNLTSVHISRLRASVRPRPRQLGLQEAAGRHGAHGAGVEGAFAAAAYRPDHGLTDSPLPSQDAIELFKIRESIIPHREKPAELVAEEARRARLGVADGVGAGLPQGAAGA